MVQKIKTTSTKIGNYLLIIGSFVAGGALLIAAAVKPTLINPVYVYTVLGAAILVYGGHRLWTKIN